MSSGSISDDIDELAEQSKLLSLHGQKSHGMERENCIVRDNEWKSGWSSPKFRQKRDDDSENDWEGVQRKRTKRVTHKFGDGSGLGRQKKKMDQRRKDKHAPSDVGSEEEFDAESPSPVMEKPRTNCTFDKKCFKQSLNHEHQFIQPEDSDYSTSELEAPEASENNDAISDSEENDNGSKEQYPFDANCFRENLQRKLDIMHAEKAHPERESDEQTGNQSTHKFLTKRSEEMKNGLSSETLQKIKENTAECIKASEFLEDFWTSDCLRSSMPEKKIKEIEMLLKRKKNKNKKLLLLSKENSCLHSKISAKELQLKEIMDKRRLSLNNAMKVYEAVNYLESETKNVDTDNSVDGAESVVSNESSVISFPCKQKLQELYIKYYKIQEIAFVLNKLVTFCGVNWYKERDLFNVISATGQISNTAFNEHCLKKLGEVMDEILIKLADVKIEKIPMQQEEQIILPTLEEIGSMEQNSL